MLEYMILFLVLGVCQPALGAEEVDAMVERQIICPQNRTCTRFGGRCLPKNTTIRCRYRLSCLCRPSCFCCFGRARALNTDGEEDDYRVKVEQLIKMVDGVHGADDVEEVEQQERSCVQEDEALVLKEMRDTLKIEALVKKLEGLEETERAEEIVKLVKQLSGKETKMEDGGSEASLPLKQINRLFPVCPSNTSCTQSGGNCALCNARCDFILPNRCWPPPCNCCVVCGTDRNSTCVRSGGNCRKACSCLEYKNTTTPCNSPFCSCCQKCKSTPMCSTGPNKGTCVSKKSCCNSKTSYIISGGCVSKECMCCKTCQKEQKCRIAGGYCVRSNLLCNPGDVAYPCGCGDKKHCSCCVPKSNQDQFSCKETPTTTTEP